MIPPSRDSSDNGNPACSPVAPTMCMRISLEALPPSTARSWTRITWVPRRAAASAQQTPDMPPPATSRSQARECSVTMRIGVA